jgi:lysophospholipase L1-like esterase
MAKPAQSGTVPGRRRTPLALVAVLVVILIAAVVALDAALIVRANPVLAGARHYYMAIGDSLSFGFQPNLDFTNGFADDLGSDLHKAYGSSAINFACARESTKTMISGGCPGRFILHQSYTSAQLDAAVAFIERHVGLISPVTLEIGANDVLPDFDQATCAPVANYMAHLAAMDQNLTESILPRLQDALATSTGHRAGDLVLLNYYNPFVRQCANSADFVHLINDHLAADAFQFRIPVVDVYAAFGGDAFMADHICDLTWICDPQFHDIHPKSAGYHLIAQAIESALNYPGLQNINPLPALPPLGGSKQGDMERRQST